MVRFFSKTEMKLVHLVKYAVLVLSLVFLGLTVYRCVIVKTFDNAALLGALNSVMYFIFVCRLNKLLKLSKGTISAYQAKIMLMYFCRIASAPLFIFCMNNNDVPGMVAAALGFILSLAGEFLFRYIDMKQNPVPINRQEGQINEQDKTK